MQLVPLQLGPTNFQLLNNLKILATAVFFRLIMKVHLNSLQWRMLIMLTVGCTMSQLTGCAAAGGSAFAGSTLGYSLKLCNACLTALGSVFCEKFLKGNRNPFHFQNLLLYSWWGCNKLNVILLQKISATRCSMETDELVLLNKRLERHASC
jgi:hypothetical protein